VIVLGTLEALFLAWSIRAVEQAPFLTMRDGYSARDMLPGLYQLIKIRSRNQYWLNGEGVERHFL
jgi:hypothetical protein